jgi:DNA-binding transcriptional LysR family regulator
MSSRFDHPMLTFEPLARGRLFCIAPEGHAPARRSRPSAADIVRHPLIGIDPNDPYGRIMAGILARPGLTHEVSIKARFGTMVCALVGRGRGIAVIDQFTLAADNWPGIMACRSPRRRSSMEALHATKAGHARKVTSGLHKSKSW